MGFYTSVPWIFIVAGVFSAGALSDLLLRKGFSRYKARNLVCATGLAISAVALVLSTIATSAVGNILWLSLALGMAGFPQTLSWSISTDIGQQFTSTVGSWMNMWGFIAASIVPTVAPIVAKSYGWNQVLIVNAGVIVLGIIGYLLIKTDQPLRMSE
jgi:ACS family glucarate transporter-like MFS transporter